MNHISDTIHNEESTTIILFCTVEYVITVMFYLCYVNLLLRSGVITARGSVQNPELDKTSNIGQNLELDKIPNGQNPELDIIPNGQNPDWTKSRMEKIPNGQNPEFNKLQKYTNSRLRLYSLAYKHK